MTTPSTQDIPGYVAVVRDARIAAGLTQAEVGHRGGFSSQYISDFENGRTGQPRIEHWIRLCLAVGADPGDLLNAAHARSAA